MDEFVEVPVPQPKKGYRDTFVGLGVLEGCLCITRWDDQGNNIEFLAMREYGEQDSWVTMFVISNEPESHCYDIIEPLMRTKEGEVLVSMYREDGGLTCDTRPRVKCYDVNGTFHRDILVSSDIDFFKVILYEESLASPTEYGRDSELKNIKHRQLYLLELGDSFEDGLRTQKKKRNKMIEKNHIENKKKNRLSSKDPCWRTSNETSPRRKGPKGKKRRYESKRRCINFHLEQYLFDIHENVLEGEALKIKRRRAPRITYQTSNIVSEKCVVIRGSSFYMAEDLLIKIVSRLPLKSLARFMCVSKQWQYLISNTITIRNAPKLLIHSRLENGHSSFQSLNQEIHIENLCSRMEEQLLRVHNVIVHSSFHGLILIQINGDMIMWNPLTKFFRKVFNACNRILYAYGSRQLDLCFDYARNEYKVVFVDTVSSPSYFREYFYVATCGTSSWEKLDVPSTVENVIQGPSVNGYKHWLCKGLSSPFHEFTIPRNHVVYFDPSTNEFIEITMPQPKTGDTDTIVGLGVLDECLCITRWDDPLSYEGKIEFLLMKEYGNGDSWDIMFVISDEPKFRAYNTMEPLFITKEGEILVYMDIGYDHRTIKAYDVHGNYLREILDSRRFDLGFILYEESWFSPTDI